jgi:hypothetical protein
MKYNIYFSTDRSSVKFAPSAFKNPFQYTDKDETSEDVSKYKKYFTKKTDENPGFKVGYMYKLERNNAKRHNLGRQKELPSEYHKTLNSFDRRTIRWRQK